MNDYDNYGISTELIFYSFNAFSLKFRLLTASLQTHSDYNSQP